MKCGEEEIVDHHQGNQLESQQTLFTFELFPQLSTTASVLEAKMEEPRQVMIFQEQAAYVGGQHINQSFSKKVQ